MSEESTPILHKETVAPARRFNSILIWAIVLIVVFSLGLLTGYLWLYAPTRQLLTAAQTDLQATTQELGEKTTALDAAEQELGDLKLKYQIAEQGAMQNELYTNLLRSRYDIARARLALTQQDTLTAVTSLDLLKADIEPVYAALEAETATALREQVDKIDEGLKARQVNDAMDALRRLDDNLALISERILK